MPVLLEDNLDLPLDEMKEIDATREDLANVIDEASADDTVTPEHYDITSYGADYDVEGLVKRLKRGDIFVPDFQRGYVWNQPMASRLIESLLLGLPVPGIFLAREASSNKLIVIDGQQRLKTLLYFYDGFFAPKASATGKKIFNLLKVQPEFEGRTYATLTEQDRIKLNDSIIHATVVKQESPDGETSMYHIFERLNNGGMKIASQEIRTAIYHGDMINLVKRLDQYAPWREIYGKESLRLKDEELILRFLALYYESSHYQQPMEGFLNRFAKKYCQAKPEFMNEAESLFKNTIDTVSASLGKKAFRPERALNAAVLDSVMVGLARNLKGKPTDKTTEIRQAYDRLLKDGDYRELVSRATSDAANVRERLTKAEAEFARIG